MSEAIRLMRELYDYHRWANHRLFDVATALGPDAERDVGTQFSVPTVKAMFAHIYGADWIWLSRWKGTSPTKLAGGDDFATLGDLRARWDEFEREQQGFVESLTEADLARAVDFKDTAGKPFRLALGGMLQHVANHATHRRSELATMWAPRSSGPASSGTARRCSTPSARRPCRSSPSSSARRTAPATYVMCGRAYEPDLIVAWPTAEISVMGPEGGTNIVFRREIAAAQDPAQERARRVDDFRKLIDPYVAAGAALVDDVIEPRETRPTLIRGLEMAQGKKVERPWRKHGVMPV